MIAGPYMTHIPVRDYYSYIHKSQVMKSVKMHINGWMGQEVYNICTGEFYLATMKNETVSFGGKWVELGIIIVCKTDQIQKDKEHVYLHIWT